MNILVACLFGMNRSVYLKNYLREKGYKAESGGIREEHEFLQRKIDNADVIVSVQSYIQDELKKNYVIEGQRMIALDVEDSPEKLQGEALDGMDWETFQNTYTYPTLVRQINQHLPFE